MLTCNISQVICFVGLFIYLPFGQLSDPSALTGGRGQFCEVTWFCVNYKQLLDGIVWFSQNWSPLLFLIWPLSTSDFITFCLSFIFLCISRRGFPDKGKQLVSPHISLKVFVLTSLTFFVSRNVPILSLCLHLWYVQSKLTHVNKPKSTHTDVIKTHTRHTRHNMANPHTHTPQSHPTWPKQNRHLHYIQ